MYRVYPDQLNRLKRVDEFHGLKRQLLFSEASQTGNGANHMIFQLELKFFSCK